MRLLNSIFFIVFFGIISGDDLEKYRLLREQCERIPSNSECLQLKSKFLNIIKKCQKLQSPQQIAICQQVKLKLCAVFPSTCSQKATTKRRKSSKTTTTSTSTLSTTVTMSNSEFVKVPVDPEELRIRGEYCIRHGKEKKCQELLTNLKNTYASCNKKTSPTPITKPEELDCHSFQTHLCKAFPKFPPCLKKTPTP